jgi:hypothetical protein
MTFHSRHNHHNLYFSYTAHEILKLLKQDNQYDLLEYFHGARRDERHQHIDGAKISKSVSLSLL